MSDNGKKRRNGPPGGEGGPKKKKSHYTQTVGYSCLTLLPLRV